jgi:hypothetical protein
MQAAVGLHDLGQFHHTPMFDHSTGSIVLVAVRSLTDAKAVDASRGVRWTSLHKATARRSRGSAMAEAGEAGASQLQSPSSADDECLSSGWRLLLDGAHAMIVHRCLGSQVLPRGLYVGYLKLTCGAGGIVGGGGGKMAPMSATTRDAVNVIVPRHQPNVLPYVKVRDNPNVTRWKLCSFGFTKLLFM